MKKLRAAIDDIDDRILRALAQRRKKTLSIIRKKTAGGRPLRDERREESVLGRLISVGRKLGLDAQYVTRVFHEVIDDSVRFQERQLLGETHPLRKDAIRVVYQGIEGAYSQLAAERFFARDLDRTTMSGCASFEDVVRSVEEGGSDCGFLPIENTTAGSINEVYDLLAKTHLSIVGEEVLPIRHCLLAVQEVPTSRIRRVLSHPQALAQCTRFLSKLENCQSEYCADTALAVQKVKRDQDLSQAAIASETAGRRYGLKVLQRDVADHRDNFTRFLAIAPKPVPVDSRVPCKTSLVMAVAHHEGALLRALDVFHRNKINLTKLESRPRRGASFQYMFYLDFQGNVTTPQVDRALTDLKPRTTYLKVLGSYPAQKRRRTAPSSSVLRKR
ncbi:prephenate dehydratase [Elusimicrobiota bacterium]